MKKVPKTFIMNNWMINSLVSLAMNCRKKGKSMKLWWRVENLCTRKMEILSKLWMIPSGFLSSAPPNRSMLDR